MISRGFLSQRHPVLAHVIPMRRCNLACAYCNEYDNFSEPVPFAEMKRRLDKLADLGTAIITISGGEPMMHPQIFEIVAHIRRRGMIAGLITNGFYLTPEKIKRFNAAGLEYLQISIDNIEPDEVSKKSLRLLDKRLQWLAEHADFQVNINSVIGGGIKQPEDAIIIGRRALELGFTATVGVIHDGQGELKPLAARAISTSAKTVSSITAPSNAARPASRLQTTRKPTSTANTRQKNGARPTAPSPAHKRPRSSTTRATSCASTAIRSANG